MAATGRGPQRGLALSRFQLPIAKRQPSLFRQLGGAFAACAPRTINWRWKRLAQLAQIWTWEHIGGEATVNCK